MGTWTLVLQSNDVEWFLRVGGRGPNLMSGHVWTKSRWDSHQSLELAARTMDVLRYACIEMVGWPI